MAEVIGGAVLVVLGLIAVVYVATVVWVFATEAADVVRYWLRRRR